MAITIENSTAEAIYKLLKQVPASEVERLRLMLNQDVPETVEEEEPAWYQMSHAAMARFFEDEHRH